MAWLAGALVPMPGGKRESLTHQESYRHANWPVSDPERSAQRDGATIWNRFRTQSCNEVSTGAGFAVLKGPSIVLDAILTIFLNLSCSGVPVGRKERGIVTDE